MRGGWSRNAHKVVAEEHQNGAQVRVDRSGVRMGKGDGNIVSIDRNNSSSAFAQPFEQITTLTGRCGRDNCEGYHELDETCREVRDAARVIGDAELFRRWRKLRARSRETVSASLSSKLARHRWLRILPQLYSQRACISRPAKPRLSVWREQHIEWSDACEPERCQGLRICLG